MFPFLQQPNLQTPFSFARGRTLEVEFAHCLIWDFKPLHLKRSGNGFNNLATAKLVCRLSARTAVPVLATSSTKQLMTAHTTIMAPRLAPSQLVIIYNIISSCLNRRTPRSGDFPEVHCRSHMTTQINTCHCHSRGTL